MSILATKVLPIITATDPQCVWDALTATGRPLDYLYGMTVESDWQAGSAVTIGLAGGWPLSGEVLLADRPETLSYTLGDRTDDTSVYVTWRIRSETAGTVVRLYVDEPFPDTNTGDELELAWLPALSKLLTHLDRCAPSGPAPSMQA
jgi:uncharacterized protein YndB with AHSA1/START domain